MITSNGRVKCDKCGKEHVLELTGSDFLMSWYCRHRYCRHFNREDSSKTQGLDKSVQFVVDLGK